MINTDKKVSIFATLAIVGWALIAILLSANQPYDQQKVRLDHMAEVCSSHGGVKSFDMTGDFTCEDGSMFSVGNIEVKQ